MLARWRPLSSRWSLRPTFGTSTSRSALRTARLCRAVQWQGRDIGMVSPATRRLPGASYLHATTAGHSAAPALVLLLLRRRRFRDRGTALGRRRGAAYGPSTARAR